MSRNVRTVAARVVLSAGVAMAGWVWGAGTAYADPGFIEPVGPYQWCPGGQPTTLAWDQSICHTFWIVARGARQR